MNTWHEPAAVQKGVPPPPPQVLTVNVPVVYMARDVMIFGPKWHLLPSLTFQGTKKSWFSGPTPFNGPRNGFSRIKIVTSKSHIKNRYIGNFMYMTFVFCFLNLPLLPTPTPTALFVPNNLEINIHMKSALDRPPVQGLHSKMPLWFFACNWLYYSKETTIQQKITKR